MATVESENVIPGGSVAPSTAGTDNSKKRGEGRSRLRTGQLTWSAIEETVQNLNRRTDRAEYLGFLILSVSAIHLFLLALTFIAIFIFPNEINRYLWVFVSSCVSVSAVVISGSFETVRKDGEALYQEISDEIQQRLVSDKNSSQSVLFGVLSTSAESSFPSFDYRMALRRWVAKSEPPLIPGKYSPALYALLNILLTAIIFAVSLIWRLN